MSHCFKLSINFKINRETGFIFASKIYDFTKRKLAY